MTMFGSDDPSEAKYYTSESAYGKTVLRQCERMDQHVYELLSARIAVDTATLLHFLEQDDRLDGQRSERAERRFRRGCNELLNLFQLLPEAAEEEQRIEEVVDQLVDEDKKQ